MLTYEEAGRDQNHSWLATAEHLLPRSKGGENTAQNIVAACVKCNTDRKDHPLEIWLPRVAFRLNQAGNPAFFEVIIARLKGRGIVVEPPPRINTGEALTANEKEPRHGSDQATLDPRAPQAASDL